MVVPILNKHIDITPGIVGGKPRIKGHRITVQNIAIWHERMGKSADEISAEYGLTLAEIYAALSYYFDHQDEINESIREGEAFAKEIRRQNNSVLARKLLSRGAKGSSLLSFAGSIPSAELTRMQKAIEEGCERIDLDE